MCPGCSRPVSECRCGGIADVPESAGPVRVRREKKGRKGKTVTLVEGIPLGAAELAALAKRLKKRCGSGGTARDGVIEIQGDHCDAVAAELEGRGFEIRRA